MRCQFIRTESRKEANKTCPWAVKMIHVDNGYMAFESWQAYQTWRNQK